MDEETTTLKRQRSRRKGECRSMAREGGEWLCDGDRVAMRWHNTMASESESDSDSDTDSDVVAVGVRLRTKETMLPCHVI